MRYTVVRTFLLVFVLALAGMGTACQSSGTARTDAAQSKTQAKAKDPAAELDKKLLILKEPRDMRLAVVRLSRNGYDEEYLLKMARSITMGDLREYAEANAEANRLTYLGAGRFRLDSLHMIMGDAAIEQASFFLRLKSFEVTGKDIDGIILERMVLDGKDMTPAGGLALYLQLLETKMSR